MAERKAFLVRLTPALYDELQRMASEELRSANGQIEYLLREAVEKRRGKRLPAEESSEGEDRDV
jgi:hypothetical protein